MFWSKKPATIAVEFIDAETGQSLFRSDMPPEQLPASFEAATQLDVKEQKYEVVRAEPLTAEEFKKTGKLRLALRKITVTYANPKEMLFSLPSICDEIPATADGSTKIGKSTFEIHEDDWRQNEFVVRKHDELIERELAQIRAIHETKRSGPGFKKLHVRVEIKRPLDTAVLSLDDLQTRLGLSTKRYDGISYRGMAGLLKDGFALQTASKIVLFGVQNQKRIEALCVDARSTSNGREQDVQSLVALANDLCLDLVAWCPALRMNPKESTMSDWLMKLK